MRFDLFEKILMPILVVILLASTVMLIAVVTFIIQEFRMESDVEYLQCMTRPDQTLVKPKCKAEWLLRR